MRSPACKYQQPDFWEWTLGKQDVWNDLFVPPEQLRQPVFVNACVADEQRVLLDNNWACYPNTESILGFVQYIFLPTVFYYVLHPENDRLMVPIQSTTELLEMVYSSESPHRLAMSGFVFELSSIWQRSGEQQELALRHFCSRFNHYWQQKGLQLSLNIFCCAQEVALYLKELIWCEELFLEEFGYSYAQLDELCRRFETEPFAKHLLLNWLNTRVSSLT
ncbi:hypothetical protein [Clostridium merdae]|uniref:hypothetical protein n=1 Tax=Clostridium merdae TaxID=1958780 RepID=UPI000A26C8BE|nr:hypothetical protein [Clostridium merdae]